jgi:hypothetical protein
MASREHVHIETDHTTGEVLRSAKTFTQKVKVQPFISIPFPVSGLLHTLTSAKDFRVLLALAELAEFNTNTVFLVARRRQQVMALAQVSSAQLSSSLKRLRTASIIDGAKGEATIHPTVMWKGDTATKNATLAAGWEAAKSNSYPIQD